MWYIAGVSVLVMASVIAGFSRNKSNTEPDAGSLNLSETSLSGRSLSRNEVNILLSRLEKEPPPESVMGAMCYAPVANPLAAEYICPVCGEKTLYNSSYASFIDRELTLSRRIAESINLNTEFDILLDETRFCDFCSSASGNEDPVLLLSVVCEDDSVTTNNVTVTDLRMLDSFLQGNLYYSTSNDAQYPLQDHAERIRSLLGFEK